jgi:hypothetical protein
VQTNHSLGECTRAHIARTCVPTLLVILGLVGLAVTYVKVLPNLRLRRALRRAQPNAPPFPWQLTRTEWAAADAIKQSFWDAPISVEVRSSRGPFGPRLVLVCRESPAATDGDRRLMIPWARFTVEGEVCGQIHRVWSAAEQRMRSEVIGTAFGLGSALDGLGYARDFGDLSGSPALQSYVRVEDGRGSA